MRRLPAGASAASSAMNEPFLSKSSSGLWLFNQFSCLASTTLSGKIS